MLASLISKLEENKKRKRLKELARREFEQARGTYHLQMLEDAHTKLTANIRASNDKLQQLRAESDLVDKRCQTQLRQVIERYLISTRIKEIPGIGDILGATILISVYKTKLSDLYNASAYPGIGKSKQYSIDTWVRRYEKQIPTFLKQDFPGKQEIIESAEIQSAALTVQIHEMKATKSTNEEILANVERWQAILSSVTVSDFINARVGNIDDSSFIEAYMNGVFAEWEPMPEWFKQAITGGQDVR